jgi:hypothetical protein
VRLQEEVEAYEKEFTALTNQVPARQPRALCIALPIAVV